MNQQNYLDILEIGAKEQCCSSLCCCGGSLMAGGDPAVADITVPQPARWREWARWSRGAVGVAHNRKFRVFINHYTSKPHKCTLHAQPQPRIEPPPCAWAPNVLTNTLQWDSYYIAVLQLSINVVAKFREISPGIQI